MRKIDYVLVYKVSDDKNEDEDEKQETREIYQANLKKNGVEMEIEPEAVSVLREFTIYTAVLHLVVTCDGGTARHGFPGFHHKSRRLDHGNVAGHFEPIVSHCNT